MKKYFKFIGILEIIFWVVTLIAFIVLWVSVAEASKKAGGITGQQTFLYVVILIFLIIVGPALGALFIAFANCSARVDLLNTRTIKIIKETTKNKEDIKHLSDRQNPVE